MAEREIQLADMFMSPRSTIRECLTVIDKHGIGTVCVVDGDHRLIGVLDEADIRKALIGGSGPDEPVGELVHGPKTTVPVSIGRAEALDLMQTLGVAEVPVVDDVGRVVGVHVIDGVVGVERRANCAVVMAGGRGTRLSPLTDDVPKPMLPIAGRPILERLVMHLVSAGIEQIYLSINYLGHVIERHFGDGSSFGCAIEYLREEPDVPLGTGGPLRLLNDKRPPDAPVLVMNGDLVTGVAVGELLDAHARTSAVATIAASEYRHQVPFGVLEGNGDQLERIVEKPSASWPVNAGIYVLELNLNGEISRHKIMLQK
jgi:CTP:molybdopterin cytidylyltransferase MocA